ncbi:MAG: hypothetical protein ACE5D7_11590, partial [Fidelibacterota bacterium]
ISWEIENTDEWVFINNSVISGYNGDEITYNSGAPFCLGVCDPPLDFTIYRDDEFLQNISGTTEFTDTGLPEGITHCYTVSWNFDEYESDLSNEACATTFVFDCAGVQNGGAYFDECDNCCAGTTGVECSYWESEENFGGLMDCSGECEGTAWINDCGCVEGNTGYEFDFCYGCTDPAASNYDPQAIFDCNGDNSCCEYPVLLSLQNADYANSTLDLYIDTPVDIGGFSITFLGTTLDSVSGGLAEEYGYDVTISGNTIIGVPNEEPIPSQSGMLSRLTLDSPGYTYILIVNSVINSVENEPLPVENGEGFSWQPGYGWENCGDLGLFADCNGTCFSNYQLSMVGDGVCDQSESFLDFFCAEWNYDEGDCVGQPLTFVQGTTSESNGWITVTSTTFSGSAGMPLTVQIGPPFIVGNGGDTPPPENEEYSSWDVFLSITNFEDGVIEISMNNYEVVAGFQFNIITSFSDFEVSGAGGGSAGNAGFMISTNLSGLVLGFSLAGSSIDENQGGCGAGEFVDCNGNCFPNSELSHL